MTVYDDVRNGSVSVFAEGQVNLSNLQDLQASLPSGISVGAAAAVEVDLFSAGPFGAGGEATQGVFLDGGQSHTNFTAGALFADISTFGPPVELGFELFFSNSDFDDFSGASTALEVGLFGGFGITVPTKDLDQIPQLVSDLASQSSSLSDFLESFLEGAPPGSAVYPSVGTWGVGVEQQFTFETPDITGFLRVIGEGMMGPNAAYAFHCFLSSVPIQMWPLDPLIKPRADGTYDEELVLSKVWEKSISEIRVGDLVVSYDEKGRVKPGPVTRTMQNEATHILDFWGTGVTPGHAYYCADGKFMEQHVPLMDILRTDGAIMRTDGTKIRAATNCKVGSMGDMMIHASATQQKPDGTWSEPKPGKVRLGTRIILPDGQHTSFMEMAANEGWRISDDGHMIGVMKGEDGSLKERTFMFPYGYGEDLPKPEDYILTRSDVTLEGIYAAGEWEQIGTRMPAPAGMVDLNTNHTSTLLKPSKPAPNIPPSFADHEDRPIGYARKAFA